MLKQYPAVDVMKFLAAIGIIVLHCELPYISAITRIGLYFFFVASAYFVFSKYRQEAAVQKQKNLSQAFCGILVDSILYGHCYIFPSTCMKCSFVERILCMAY